MVDEDTGPIWGDCTNGRGGFRWEDGSYYEGEWEGGVMSGRGRITFADQNRFDGNFRKCQFHGRGTFTWADDGVFWAGQWRNMKARGPGQWHIADGRMLEGPGPEGLPFSHEGKLSKKAVLNRLCSSGSGSGSGAGSSGSGSGSLAHANAYADAYANF